MIPGTAVAAEALTAPRNAANLKRLTDGQLLKSFFEHRDDAAFSLLVERYGPLVLGVCRRILPDANDAEDAFQATFLVLVRKGASLRDPARLASWLYGVAYRTARKARARAALRSKSERQAGAMASKSASGEPGLASDGQSAPGSMTYEELQAILDEEISRLPEKYALPLVLCYLEGKTNAQAAAQLGWPEGSMSRRLSRARELLRSRLARRGLALSAALISAVFARNSSAAVSGELLAATTRACALVADGVELCDVVSPATAQLVKDVTGAMSAVSRFAMPSLAVLAAMLLVVSAAVWQLGPMAQGPGVFSFHRGETGHALVTTPTSASTAGLTVGGEGGCGSVTSSEPAPAACSATAP